MPSNIPKYKTLSIEEKMAVLLEVRKGVKSKSSIAKDFNIPASTLSTFIKNEKKIEDEFTCLKKKAKKQTKVRKSKYPEVEKCLIKWFTQEREKKIPLSGPILRSKAIEFADLLNIDNFEATNGWFDGFKGRHGIVFKNVCGESGAVNVNEVSDWKKLLAEMIGEVNPKDIFNVDEAGLFYQCTPDKSLAFKGQICNGGKLSKVRVTLLIGANMDGSEKLPLLMIGKSANPRCFKNIKNKPVQYESNAKAWMTTSIFEKVLSNLDLKFRKQKRTILLFIDNCTAHPVDTKLTNIKVIFFPANMTSVLQPMDQGVIKTFKHYYRREVILRILAGKLNIFFLYQATVVNIICLNINTFCIGSGKKIDILEASVISKQAWDMVSSEAIVNCFKKAGFFHKEINDNIAEVEVDHADFENEFYNRLERNIPFEQYINIDKNLAICGTLTDRDIVEEIENDAESSENEDQVIDEPKITPGQALDSICTLRRFLYAQDNISEDLLQSLDKLQTFATIKKIQKCTQKNLDHYFKK